ncbi:hypothetical protein NA78x_000965 [Anatilimnocola sp. NA78]|uniref:hypothetical protein n=1 Tax=Anatilimnocola sp. NA78 TaxID=3415683 RepID=UPI003CE463D0
MVRRADADTIAKAREILKVARARPMEERVADLLRSGIVDENGQVIHKNVTTGYGKTSNGCSPVKKIKKPSNGKHS